MNTDVPLWLSLIAWTLALAVLAWASLRLPLHKLEGDGEAMRVLLVGTVLLLAMRWFNTAPLHGVSLHFLGASIATLMFGVRFALWVMALVSLSGWAMHAVWLGWAQDFLLTGVLPVLVTAAVSRVVVHRLPHNIFIYILFNAFLAGALAMAASTLGKAMVAAFLHTGTAWAYLAATPLLMFGEAFFTGTMMALIVVYRPQWCASFDDALYLGPPASRE